MVCEHLHTSRRARARTLGMCGTQIQPRQPHAPTGPVAGLLGAQGRLQLEGHLPPPRKRGTESGQEDRGHGQEGVSPIVKRATRCRMSRGACSPALPARGPVPARAAVGSPDRNRPCSRGAQGVGCCGAFAFATGRQAHEWSAHGPSGLCASESREGDGRGRGGRGGRERPAASLPPASRGCPSRRRTGGSFRLHHRRRPAWPGSPRVPAPLASAPGSACQSFPQALERWISANAPAAIPRPRPFLEQLSVPNMCLQSPPVALGRRGSIPRTACRSVSVFIVTIISIRSSTF